MIRLNDVSVGCGDSDANLLQRRAAPLTWPSDHMAFLRATNGGYAAPNAFFVRSGVFDTIARVYGVADILRQKAALSDRLMPVLWPIADTTGGNFVVLISDEAWRVGFFDHETESLTEVAKTFADFYASVGDPPRPRLRPDQVVSVTVKPGFAEKFAKYKKND